MGLSFAERAREMQADQHQQEAADNEQRLVNDGTWPAMLESYEKMDLDRLPTADAAGYRLCYTVIEGDKNKRVWFNVFFKSVKNAKGQVLQSKLGTMLTKIGDITPEDTEEALLERLKGIPVMLRVQKKAGTPAYPKPSNAVWAVTLPR